MGLVFPSPDFDDAVSAVCHGTASDDQQRDLNRLLLGDQAACDEYLLRLELHARLASTPDLFDEAPELPIIQPLRAQSQTLATRPRFIVRRHLGWVFAAGLCIALALLVDWQRQDVEPPPGATSTAVAMLNRTVDAQWSDAADTPKLESPLEPGWLKLKSGLAEVVFYSGARVTLKGPASFQLISSQEAFCERGKLTAEVPTEARGFRVETPQGVITDLGTAFGLSVTAQETEVHVFKGSVKFQSLGSTASQELQAGAGAFMKPMTPSSELQLVTADSERFASLFNLEKRCAAAQASRYERWRLASDKLNLDSSLLVHFDFEYSSSTEWQLRNASADNSDPASATIIGCRWHEGRWPSKSALEFQSVNDRVRLNVPGQYDALTMTAWIRVQGLDRKFNSLFMSEGFEPGTVHWLIRNDGVLGLTVFGQSPGAHQIIASPSVISLDRFGMWLHLAVVLDSRSERVQHYVNGKLVDEQPLQVRPPYVLGNAELGNWNAHGFQGHDSLLIRNFSGAMDEFCLFGRALRADEIESQYHDGDPRTPH